MNSLSSNREVKTCIDFCDDLAVLESLLFHRSGRTRCYTASASLTKSSVDVGLQAAVGLNDGNCLVVTASLTDTASVTVVFVD